MTAREPGADELANRRQAKRMVERVADGRRLVSRRRQSASRACAAAAGDNPCAVRQLDFNRPVAEWQ